MAQPVSMFYFKQASEGTASMDSSSNDSLMSASSSDISERENCEIEGYEIVGELCQNHLLTFLKLVQVPVSGLICKLSPSSITLNL